MQIKKLEFKIEEFKNLKKYPKELYYIGNLELLKKRKISIVGSRKPIQYTKDYSCKLASKLAQYNFCIVSGGAIGVDTISHKCAKPKNTIMVSATGLNQRYPSINKKLIQNIEEEGLIISQFEPNSSAFKYNFVIRNELIVALGEVLVVTQADLNSGTSKSIEYALKQNKQIYVLPHRIDDSKATNQLLKKNLAKAIYDIDEFIESLGVTTKKIEDEFLIYCSSNPTYEEAINKFGSKVYEYELNGKIIIKNGKIFVE